MLLLGLTAAAAAAQTRREASYYGGGGAQLGISTGVGAFPRASGSYRHLAAIMNVGVGLAFHLNPHVSVELAMQMVFLRASRPVLPGSKDPFLQTFTLDARLYLLRATPRRPLAPYLAGGMGVSQIGYTCREEACGDEDATKRAVGGVLQLALGLDLFAARFFVVGLRASYRYVMIRSSTLHGLFLDLSVRFSANSVR